MGDRIVVPAGMLQAADEALAIEQENYRLWLNGDKNLPVPGSNGYPLLLMMRAAIRWYLDNPAVPTREQIEALEKVWHDSGARENEPFEGWLVQHWTKRMFLAPEPEVPEAIKDLLSNLEPADYGVSEKVQEHFERMKKAHNKDVIEAYRRGKESR